MLLLKTKVPYLHVDFIYDQLPPFCSTEVLSPSEHTAQLQRSEILEECEQGTNCCYTLKSVEKIMKKVRKFNKNPYFKYICFYRLF